MALIPMRVLLDHAAENNYGVGAFNVNNLEQIQAIMEAARKTESPVIIQASRGARKYAQDAFLRNIMLAAVELFPEIPVALGCGRPRNRNEMELAAIESGFDRLALPSDAAIELAERKKLDIRFFQTCCSV